MLDNNEHNLNYQTLNRRKMKYILTINWTLINFDEVAKIEYENNENLDRWYSYFILKNGEKYDAHDAPDYFQVDGEQDYLFCAWCHKTFNVLLLNYIYKNDFTDIEKIQDELWEEFIEKCRDVLPSIEKKIKCNNVFG